MFGRDKDPAPPPQIVHDPGVFVAPVEPRSPHTDHLVEPPQATPTPPGTGDLNQPERQQGSSMQYHRPPIGTLVDTTVQNLGIGAEVKQAGAGRAFIPGGLAFPVQSDTPIPDGRRIARPMPSTARDEAEVIRP